MLRLLFLLTLSLLSSGNPIDVVNDFVENETDQEVETPVDDIPKWYNHCMVIPEASHHFSKRLSQTESTTTMTSIDDLFQNVRRSALNSLRRAEDLKQKFIINKLDKTSVNSEGLGFKQYEWLPTIPVSEDFFKDMTKEMTLLRAHEYIEKFAVAFEQIILDLNDRHIPNVMIGHVYGKTINKIDFEDIDDFNYNVLCEIRYALSVVFGSVNESVFTKTERIIMPEEDRRNKNMSIRMLRDYIILRQYVKTLDFITKMIDNIREDL